MAMQEIQKTILKINIPFASESIFVNIENINQSLEAVFHEVAESFEEDGRSSESAQLLALLTDHQPFIKGNPINMNTPISSIKFDPRTIDDNIIQFAEVSLLRAHQGGL